MHAATAPGNTIPSTVGELRIRIARLHLDTEVLRAETLWQTARQMRVRTFNNPAAGRRAEQTVPAIRECGIAEVPRGARVSEMAVADALMLERWTAVVVADVLVLERRIAA